ncbi:TOBE domain-containing protein [Sorangium sp. So ce394]|uniref:TOBE domain-containing protein n=1 Tax=Sorangium sp. So ce394 TaxID=3133310 RepID=UPI003F5B1B88
MAVRLSATHAGTIGPLGTTILRVRVGMQISGRNKIPGKITEIVVGDVMAKVVMEGPGGTELVAVITSDAVKELGLSVGKEVQALIKATEIMVIAE